MVERGGELASVQWRRGRLMLGCCWALEMRSLGEARALQLPVVNWTHASEDGQLRCKFRIRVINGACHAHSRIIRHWPVLSVPICVCLPNVQCTPVPARPLQVCSELTKNLVCYRSLGLCFWAGCASDHLRVVFAPTLASVCGPLHHHRFVRRIFLSRLPSNSLPTQPPTKPTTTTTGRQQSTGSEQPTDKSPLFIIENKR